MHDANLQERTGRIIRRVVGTVLAFALLACAGAAAADPSEPTPAEQKWIDRFFAFIETGEPGDHLIHESRLVKTALRPFQLDHQQLRVFHDVAIADKFLRSFWDELPDDAWATFLRMRDLEDGRVALFRIHGDSGLNYLEWYLAEQPGEQGRVSAWDVNIYVTGESLSQSLRRLWLPAVAQLDEQVRKHMGQRNRDLAANLDRMTQIRAAVARGDHAKAVSIYEALPETIQEERVLIVYAMDSYFELGKEDRYLALLELFLDRHGEASNRELMLMDVYIYRKQYDKSIEMIDDLDKRVGGDVYLESYRGSIAYQSGDYQRAKTYYDRGIAKDPSVLDFYWESIGLALEEKDWARVGVMLDAVQAQGIELNPLGETEGYEAYVQTQAYQDWLERQSKAVQDEQLGVAADDNADAEE